MTPRSQVREFYLERFGKPSREAEFVPREGPAIEILKWDESKSGEGVCIYATLGASEALVGSPDRRCEFFIGLLPAVDDVVAALAEVALHGTGDGRVPKAGDTVTLAYPLWPSTTATTFLFSNGDENLPPLQTDDTLVCFVKVVPIFPDELEFKKRHGTARLWEEFQRKQVPFWDPGRSSALLTSVASLGQ
jgi:hypothetical protein